MARATSKLCSCKAVTPTTRHVRPFCVQASRPGFTPDDSSVLLSLNTGSANRREQQTVNSVLERCYNHKSMFVGRLPLIGICVDGQSSYMKGPRKAPRTIREAFLCSSGSTDQYFPDVAKFINTDTAFIDCGDYLPMEDHNDLETHQDICNLVSDVMDVHCSEHSAAGYEPHPILVLGGDHSITFSVLSGFKKRHEHAKTGVIHFDAHPDLYPPYIVDESTAYSHASPFHNALESGCIEQLMQVGIRCMTSAQQITLDTHKDRITQLHMEQLFGYGKDYFTILHDSVFKWLQKCIDSGVTQVYITIDMDVLDPCFVPGVSHYEPLGLSTRELLLGLDVVMKQIYSKHFKPQLQLIGCDIVEYNPVSDVNHMTAFVAARLLRRIAANSILLSQTEASR